jgi:putative membrane protein
MMAMSLALLHTGARLSVTSFTVHPSTVIGIVGLAALYERGMRVAARGAQSAGRDSAHRPATRVFFYGALLIMFLSLNGWLHDLSDSYLFSAHMVQHLMLALVVAPFMIMGTPGELLRPVLALPGVMPVARWITAPSRCFAIFTAVVAGWHLPPLYNYALLHHPVHIVQHLMFLAVICVLPADDQRWRRLACRHLQSRALPGREQGWGARLHGAVGIQEGRKSGIGSRGKKALGPVSLRFPI